MPGDEPSSTNPFVLWKRHINAKIGSTVQSVVDLPSRISRHNAYFRDLLDDKDNPDENQPDHSNRDIAPSRQTPIDPPSCPNFTMNRVSAEHEIQQWNEWAQLSPYSPYNLRHLPQPVPSDLTVDIDAKHLGFEAAFEDLLAVSQSRPMMDLRQRVDMKSKILEFFGSGEPSLLWVSRLYRDGLLLHSGYIEEPVHRRVEQSRPTSMEEWAKRRRDMIRVRDKAWARAHESMDRPQLFWWADQDLTLSPGQLIRKFEKGLEEIEKELDRNSAGNARGTHASGTNEHEESNENADCVSSCTAGSPQVFENTKVFVKELAGVNNAPSATVKSAEAPQRLMDKQQGNNPATEVDMVEFVFDAKAQVSEQVGNNSLDVFSRFLDPNGLKEPSTRTAKEPEKPAVITPMGQPEETIESKTEFVDMFGFLHTKTTMKKLNEKGEVIGQYINYDIRSAPQTPKPGETDSQVSTSDQKKKGTDDDKKLTTGWFWK